MAANTMDGALAGAAGQVVLVDTVIVGWCWAEVDTTGSTSEDLASVDGRRSLYGEGCVQMVGWAVLPSA